MSINKLTTVGILQNLANESKSEYINLQEINHALHERGFGILLLFFSIPTAIPLPYPPGFTSLVGLPLMFFTFQMLLGYDSPRLPKWIGEKKIKFSTMKAVIDKTLPVLIKLERFVKPRLDVVSNPIGERIIGLVGFLCAVSVFLPIIFGNAIPSLGIFIMALGLLNRDGLVIIAGFIVSIIGLIIAATVVMLGAKAVTLLIKKTLSFFGF